MLVFRILIILLGSVTFFFARAQKELNLNSVVSIVSDSNNHVKRYFSVQLVTLSRPIDKDHAYSKYPLLLYKENKFFKYFIGYYKEYRSAVNMRKLLLKDGVEDAIIKCIGINKMRSLNNDETNIFQNDNVENVDSNYKTEKLIDFKDIDKLDNPNPNIIYLDPSTRTASVSDSNEFKKVFFTVQLGAYSKPLEDPNKFFNCPLYLSNHNSLYKYCNGRCNSLNEARKLRMEFVKNGIKDAFIISYGIPSDNSFLNDEKVDLEINNDSITLKIKDISLDSSLNKKSYLRLCQKYCPSLTISDLEPYRSGVRAQAVSKDGKLIHDFLIEETSRSFHVCNAPSPAATSSLPIGKYIVELINKKIRKS